MSGAPSEPEKYSIDEMMDRLKSPFSGNSEQEGELVVRADGTQAIRVRKRKRRSTQPVKEQNIRNRRARIMQVSATMGLVAVAGFTIGGAVIYSNSPPFREGLLRKISQSTGAEVDLQMFRMNPKSANANTVQLKWPEGNMLQSLYARGIIADISPSSFLGKSMSGEEITVIEGKLALRIPKPGEPLGTGTAATLENALPIQFKRYRVSNFGVTLGDSANPTFSLLKSEASFSPTTLNGRTQFRLTQGDLTINGWPNMRMSRAFVEFRGKEVDVVGLRLMDETDNRGIFELSGTVLPYSPKRLSTLRVQLESFPLSGLTNTAFGKLFSGRIDSLPTTESNYLSFFSNETPAAKLAITFRSSLTSNIEVSGFPFLAALSQMVQDDWFQRPVFEGQDATGSLLRETGSVSLHDFSFENKDRMALRGRITMAANQNLSGNLEVGLAELLVDTAKTPRLKSLLGPAKDGFRWITLKIGGTATSPTDNFKDLYLAPNVAHGAESEESDHKISTFEELTTPKR